MKKRTAHLKVLSLLLIAMLTMSCFTVFAEGDEPVGNNPTTNEASDEVNGSDGSAADESATDNAGADAQSPNLTAASDDEELSITLDKTSANVDVGKTVALNATTKPSDATVTWTSSDTSVATVSNGTVTGVKAGSATITASIGEGDSAESATCAVTVKSSFTNVKPVITLKKKYSGNDYEGAKDNGYILSWTQSEKSGVTGYQILCDNKVLVNNIKATETSREILVPSGKHTYVVKAVGADSKSISSDAKAVTVSGVITSTHPYKWYCTTKKQVKTGGITIPKGTKLEAIGRSPAKIKKFRNPKKVQVVYKNKKVWVPYKSLKGGVKSAVNVSQDYSRSLKEQMVNSKSFQGALKGKAITSKDNYLIWACLYTQRAYTFQKKGGKWVLIHTDRITTGKFSHPTRSSETSGVYTIKKKKSGKVWMVQQNGKRYYYTNASYITNGISFHTGTWWASGKARGSVIKSGQPGTYGCIRMYTAGAKYIFGKTAVGKTGVIVTRFN